MANRGSLTHYPLLHAFHHPKWTGTANWPRGPGRAGWARVGPPTRWAANPLCVCVSLSLALGEIEHRMRTWRIAVRQFFADFFGLNSSGDLRETSIRFDDTRVTWEPLEMWCVTLNINSTLRWVLLPARVRDFHIEVFYEVSFSFPDPPTVFSSRARARRWVGEITPHLLILKIGQWCNLLCILTAAGHLHWSGLGIQ